MSSLTLLTPFLPTAPTWSHTLSFRPPQPRPGILPLQSIGHLLALLTTVWPPAKPPAHSCSLQALHSLHQEEFFKRKTQVVSLSRSESLPDCPLHFKENAASIAPANLQPPLNFPRQPSGVLCTCCGTLLCIPHLLRKEVPAVSQWTLGCE